MVLSAATHHSFDNVAAEAKYSGPRTQKTDKAEAANDAPRRPTTSAARSLDLFQLYEEELPELLVEVPLVSPSICVLIVLVSQMGTELVEVPNVVSQSKFQQHFVQQTVDIQVLGGVGDRIVWRSSRSSPLTGCRGADLQGDLQGSVPGQEFNSSWWRRSPWTEFNSSFALLHHTV